MYVNVCASDGALWSKFPGIGCRVNKMAMDGQMDSNFGGIICVIATKIAQPALYLK